MNLVHDRWLPVLRRGQPDWVSPIELGAPDIVEFNAPRADFNGALAQFAIGLLQTTTPVQSMLGWRKLLRDSPDADTLAEWFAPHADAFEFTGEEARFMQDFDLRSTDAEPVGIGALMIESPGENAVRNNSDLFVKRGHVHQLCLQCAAMALLTLQINAPAGGVGHRTGLRGGGPLTTLLMADGGKDSPRSLWQTLWLNVQHQQVFLAGADLADSSVRHLLYPWLASITRFQQDEGQISPVQVHPAHVFWAMPRRVRLDLETCHAGECDLCGRASEALISRYVTRNYGLNYKGAWLHPLSPYYKAKDGLLPVHPQPDGLGYRHWMAWTLGVRSEKREIAQATAIARFLGEDVQSRSGIGLRLWAFGYDMDNMKARCWYETTMPLYRLADCSQETQLALRDDVGGWLAGAELAATYLRGALRDAWFSAEARGDLSAIDAAFWSRTESAFYTLLEQRIRAAGQAGQVDRIAQSEQWLSVLRTVALRLFDREWVGCAPVERMNPARVSTAYRALSGYLNGPKLRTALGLPLPAKAAKPKRAAKATGNSVPRSPNP